MPPATGSIPKQARATSDLPEPISPAPQRTGRSDHDITLDFVADLRSQPATPAESALLAEAVDACCEDPEVDTLVSSEVPG